jgi:hypothetical protein
MVPSYSNYNHRSGFDGPWTFAPTTLTNDFYKLLFEETYVSGLMTILIDIRLIRRSIDGLGKNGMDPSSSKTRRLKVS